MNRLALASVTAAAALGIAGGVGYALASNDDDAGRVGDARVRDTATTGSGSTGTGPLYFLHGTIHDGDTEVEVDGVDADRVIAVQRDGRGYLLVSTGEGADAEGVVGLHVAATGTTTPAEPPSDEERLTSPDGTTVVTTAANPDYSPTNPVGGCLAGGAVGSEPGWTECAAEPAAWQPYAPRGDLLLTGTAVGDGPPPSELQVRAVASGKVVHRFDPGGYRLSAAWGTDDDTVYVVTGSDGTAKLALRRCKVATGTCTALLEAEGNLVLGSAS